MPLSPKVATRRKRRGHGGFPARRRGSGTRILRLFPAPIAFRRYRPLFQSLFRRTSLKLKVLRQATRMKNTCINIGTHGYRNRPVQKTAEVCHFGEYFCGHCWPPGGSAATSFRRCRPRSHTLRSGPNIGPAFFKFAPGPAHGPTWRICQSGRPA